MLLYPNIRYLHFAEHAEQAEQTEQLNIVSYQIGRAHVWTPVTDQSRMPSSAWKKKKTKKKKKKPEKQSQIHNVK